MNVLNIVRSAYRATLEEQDDPVVWLVHALRGAGAELSVLLRGDAVNYAVPGQDASGLRFGEERQTQPPRIEHDLTSLMGKGVAVYVDAGDLAALGIAPDGLLEGVQPISSGEIAALVAEHDAAWHW